MGAQSLPKKSLRSLRKQIGCFSLAVNKGTQMKRRDRLCVSVIPWQLCIRFRRLRLFRHFRGDLQLRLNLLKLDPEFTQSNLLVKKKSQKKCSGTENSPKLWLFWRSFGT